MNKDNPFSETYSIGKFEVKKFCEFSHGVAPLLITPVCHRDDRGFFTERFREDDFKSIAKISHKELTMGFVQDNFSRSDKNVLRGLHFQWDSPQGKLVSCFRGVIRDLAVDLRIGSPSFGKYLDCELSGDRPQWLWIPPGFAHGFLVTSNEGADIFYKVDAFWNGSGEGSLRWNDPELNIPWGIINPNLSPKDTKAPSLSEYKQDPKFKYQR